MGIRKSRVERMAMGMKWCTSGIHFATVDKSVIRLKHFREETRKKKNVSKPVTFTDLANAGDGRTRRHVRERKKNFILPRFLLSNINQLNSKSTGLQVYRSTTLQLYN